MHGFAFWIAAVVVVGCVPAVSNAPKPGQETAMALVFRELGESPRPVPIFWTSLLNCDEGRGWVDADHGCVSGVTIVGELNSDPVYVILADSLPFSWADSALAHEICHWTKGDYAHEGACFDESELLTRTRSALRMAFATSEPPVE